MLIGTSGWTYPSWRGRFYPTDLKSQDYLRFYAKEFPTAEVNYSFYHLPKPETYEKWAKQVPEGFCFSVKASRFITHVKRLRDLEEPWTLFVDNALALGPHLGPILLQCPPSLRGDVGLLSEFLQMADGGRHRKRIRLAFEFRHESWFTEEVYALLRRHNVALCIADSPRYPRRDVVTGDFVYLRYHGREELFASRYTDEELQEEAKKIRRILAGRRTGFVYFNNDAQGFAVENARMLRTFLRA